MSWIYSFLNEITIHHIEIDWKRINGQDVIFIPNKQIVVDSNEMKLKFIDFLLIAFKAI